MFVCLFVCLVIDPSDICRVDKNWSLPGGPENRKNSSSLAWYHYDDDVFGYSSRDHENKDKSDKEEKTHSFNLDCPPNYYLKSKAFGIIKILMNPSQSYYYWNRGNEARFS